MPLYIPAFFYTPFGMVLGPQVQHALLADIREWPVDVDPNITLPNAIPNDRLRVSLYRILLEAGIAFTQGVGFQWPHMSVLAPLYRYVDLFAAGTPNLRLIAGFKNVDARFKQLLGEEIAIGIALYVLQEHMNIIHISDVGPLLHPPNGQVQRVQFAAAHVNEKRPDFYCQDNANEVVFAESKGTCGPSGPLTRADGQLERGCHQVNNVDPVGGVVRHQCGRVVIGTNIQFDTPGVRIDTTTYIRDPIRSDDTSKATDDDFPLRVAYAKILRYSGSDVLAEFLLGRMNWPVIVVEPISFNNLTLVPIGRSPIGGMITVETGIFEALSESGKSGFRDRIHNLIGAFANASESLKEQNEAIIRPNGVVVLTTSESEKYAWSLVKL